MEHAFNPSTWEAETGRSLNSWPVGPTEWIPGQSSLHSETLSQNKTKQKKQEKKNKTPKPNKQTNKQKKTKLQPTIYPDSKMCWGSAGMELVGMANQ